MQNKKHLDQTQAPIYEALQQFRQMRVVPFDVPGHKRGRGNPELAAFLGEQCVSIDVNSMKPLDNLCHPVSVIGEAEDLAADAFGAAHAFLMVGGTTSSVQTMILSTCKRGDKIILPRNVHRSVINALVLCGAIPIYVNPEVDIKLGISLGMKREQVAKAIAENPDAVAVLVNNPTYYGICSDLKEIVKMAHAAGAKTVLGLDDLLTAPVDGSGYNPQYGLLGSNKADDERVKLFPRDAMAVAEGIGKAMSQATGKQIEAMVYGDGAFKDPAGKIWELADPVVSPGYTAGLIGTPNELKLKYLADHDFGDLTGEALQKAVAEKIRQKDASVSLVGNMVSEGTTPRNLTDLIGSLCDLTSGSGDKGTPIIYIQGYFDNYTNE